MKFKKTLPVADENAVDERVHELAKNWTVVEVLDLCSNELTNFDAVFSGNHFHENFRDIDFVVVVSVEDGVGAGDGIDLFPYYCRNDRRRTYYWRFR